MTVQKTKQRQQGFALIEVMVAALILTVGGIAYMRLQQMGLQYAANNAARTQGVAVIEGFVEQLRSNVGYIRSVGGGINGAIVSGKVTAPTKNVNCSGSADCGKVIFRFHEYLTSQQMLSIVSLAGNSRLCYVERDANTGNVRVTFQWVDNSRKGRVVDLRDNKSCPAFNDNLDQNNSVTMYVQL